ncbi:hypothetical protein [Uliginosibacterium sp. H1]|uniref:hypothetical protein n=1 Tax=Uliginosibacterium sp. H1 TaxID=3114757 RepID=UPI002E17EAA6|nr:hypothetical protein [Uliginosibacterium sp. H1]
MKTGRGCRNLFATLCAASFLGLSLTAQAAADDYFDCRNFDDKNLCKLLNRYPAVKDLPVIDAGRVLELYRDKRGYAEDLLEDEPVVVRGKVALVEEKARRVTVTLNDGSDPATAVVLQLFASHPAPGAGGRVASRTAQAVQAALQPGQVVGFQCTGGGLSGKTPVFRNCVFWQ